MRKPEKATNNVFSKACSGFEVNADSKAIRLHRACGSSLDPRNDMTGIAFVVCAGAIWLVLQSGFV